MVQAESRFSFWLRIVFSENHSTHPIKCEAFPVHAPGGMGVLAAWSRNLMQRRGRVACLASRDIAQRNNADQSFSQERAEISYNQQKV